MKKKMVGISSSRSCFGVLLLLLLCTSSSFLLVIASSSASASAGTATVDFADDDPILILPDEDAAAPDSEDTRRRRRKTQEEEAVVVDDAPSATTTNCGSCTVPHVLPLGENGKKQVLYTVGVLEFRGPGTSFTQHNNTFADYLTATAGRMFDPPIQFQMRAVNFDTMFSDAGNRLVDFLYVSPSPFACVEAEYGAQSLVSHISKRVVGDNTYILPKFAGVIAARADDDSIQKITDLRNKVIGSAAISSFGGGQMQFRELQNAGMSYINDPKQLVFTGNQGEIVNGIISGKLDAGFVRTDQIQRTIDPVTGELIDPSLLKILEPKPNEIDGKPFPFEASTQLYPEWNLAALDFTPTQVSREVQQAMLALAEHSKVGDAIEECQEANVDDVSPTDCSDIGAIAPDSRCDTTPEIAAIAKQAMTNGKYAGFRTTLSYIEIRAMLQDTNFIAKDEDTNVWRCARPSELYDAIACPPGHFKKSKEDVANGCSDAGLECSEGHQCVCNPCLKAYDVDVFSLADDEADFAVISSSSSNAGCAKMSLCGTMEQTKNLTFRAVDNREREGAQMVVTVHEGDEDTRQVHVIQHNGTMPSNEYEFTISATHLGILILEISLDGEQIPESPLRVKVLERDCDVDYPDGVREADAEGNCVCTSSTVPIGDSCVRKSILYTCIFVPLGIILAIAAYWYVEHNKRKADSIWKVDPKDLVFDSPPVIIGEGTFGLVLLAEYRGTQVAVKRVLTPKKQGMDSGNKSIASSLSENNTGTMSNLFSKTADKPISSNRTRANSFQDSVDEDEEFESDIEANPTLETAPETPPKTRALGKVGLATTRRGSGMHTTAMSSTYVNSSGGIFAFRKSEYSKQKEEFVQEMRLLSKLRHPCITTVMGAVISNIDDPMLIMEYMYHGSLYDVLHNETMFVEGDLVLHFMRDIAQGVRFLHAAVPQVIHGDLKSANILVDSKFRAKVADFGLSQKKGKVATGTPFFMAPELLRREHPNTVESDMYSIGIIFYELFSRKEPYEGEAPEEVLHLICDKNISKRPPVPPSCPSEVAELMKSLLLDDPSKRPTASELDNYLKTMDVNMDIDEMNHLSHRIQKEQPVAQKSDILYQVFPKHIADVLVSGGKAEPETHDCVTIFFSDIVGFTNISSALPPLKVSDMLDRLYLAFDGLAEKHSVFKIETIGDAYMCASNLATDQSSDHVKRIAQFSMDALLEASKIEIDQEDPSKGNVQIRVGFHSGQVVSNVIGSLNPRYSLFGDTVNVSARMESTSEVGRIHCSERSAKLLKEQAPEISLKLRGNTQVKGKGTMKTYWVGNKTETANSTPAGDTS